MSLVETLPAVKKNGGARPGAGAKPQRRDLHRAANGACKEFGVTPVHIMVENMAYWYSKVQKYDAMLEKVAKKIVHEQSDDPDDVGDDVPISDLREFRDMFSKLNGYREMAQQCAVEVAPYCHPRQASIAVKQEIDVNLQTINRGDDLLQSQQRYVEYLRLNPPPIPEIEDEE